MQTSDIDISVIVPIYNVGEYLRPCLDSILGSTKDKLQVILIDDGSTDGSGEVADEYAARYANVEVHHKENGGVSHARNFGVAFAKGTYIAFADSDDLIVEDAYERMFAMAQRDGSDVAVCNVARCSESRGVFHSGVSKRVFPFVGGVTTLEESPDMIFDGTIWNKLIRRDFYLEHDFRFPLGRLYEDMHVSVGVFRQANHISVMQGVGYLWRVREGDQKSSTQQRGMRNTLDRVFALEYTDEYLDTVGASEAVHRSWMKKRVEVDLAVHLNECVDEDMTDGEALELMGVMLPYAKQNFDVESYRDHPWIDPVSRARFDRFLGRDLAGLKRVRSFQREFFGKLEVRQDDFTVSVPSEMFGSDRVSVARSLMVSGPVKRINSVREDGSCLEVGGYLYFPRVSLPNVGDQRIEAFLFSDVTGQSIPVPVEVVATPELTEKKGLLRDPYQGKDVGYNYDGAGFQVRLDLSDPVLREEVLEVSYGLRLEYGNRLGEGYVILDNFGLAPRESLQCRSVECEGLLAECGFLLSGELSVRFERPSASVCGFSLEEGSVVLELDTPVDRLWVQPAGGLDVLFASSPKPFASALALAMGDSSDRFDIPLGTLFGESGCQVFYESDGVVRPLRGVSKATKLLPCDGGVVTVSTIKDRSLRIIYDAGAFKVSRAKALGPIVLLELTAYAGGLRVNSRARCELVAVRSGFDQGLVLASGRLLGGGSRVWLALNLGSAKLTSPKPGLYRLALRVCGEEMLRGICCKRKVFFEGRRKNFTVRLYRRASSRLWLRVTKTRHRD